MNIILLIASIIVHNYYFSLTQIDYNEKSKSIEIAVKMFANDFEKELQFKYDKLYYLGNSKELPETDKAINQYFVENFKVYLDEQQKQRDLVFIGKEFEKDVIWCYFEIRNVSKFKAISIQNSILFTSINEQKNIIQLKYKGIKKNAILYKDNPNASFNFSK